MSNRKRILLSVLLGIAFLSTGVYIFIWRINQDATLITISTDRQAYQLENTIQVSIRNRGDHSINIYCPVFCALGNFPTTVEKFASGKWQYYVGFCPSIEPLLGSGVPKGDYIMHTLPAGGSFELELTNLKALHLAAAERLRIIYYVGVARKPVYSNEFTVGP